MEEEEAGGGWGYEGGDVGGGELVGAFEVPGGGAVVSEGEGWLGGGRGGKWAHLVVGPLELVGEVEAAVDDEGVHVAGFGGEAGDAVAALFGGAEFELEERLVVSADYAEVVGHGDVAGEEED